MPDFIHNLYKAIYHSLGRGIKADYSRIDQVRIKLLNTDAWMGIFVPLIVLIVVILLGPVRLSIILGVAICMVISTLSYVFNRHHYHTFAAVILLTIPYLVVVGLSIQLGTENGIQLFLLAMSISCFTYLFRYPRVSYVIFGVYIISFIWLETGAYPVSGGMAVQNYHQLSIVASSIIFSYKVLFLWILLMKTRRAFTIREKRYRQIFEIDTLAIMELDMAGVLDWMDEIRQKDVHSLEEYIVQPSQFVQEFAAREKILHVNDTFCKIIGAEDEADYLRNIHLTMTPDVTNFYINRAKAIFEGKHSFASEVRILDLQGNEKILWVSVSLPVDTTDSHSVITFVEITQQKRTEEALRKSEEKLYTQNKELQKYIESNMQLENFAYIASHDLREPLLTTMGFTRQLKMRYAHQLDEKGEMIIDHILKATHNMNDQIMGLLVYSQIHAHDQTYECFDVAEVLYEIRNDLSEMIQKYNASLNIDIGKIHIEANPYMIKKLFQNLIINGLKFHRENVSPCVCISAEKQGDQWLFSIRDNGIGIDPRNYEKIFILFKRLHNRSKYDGFGMGLAICKKILEKHHGEIWLASELGVGTVFYFTLPEKHINLTD